MKARPNQDRVNDSLFEYIELFYDRRRIHQSLVYRTAINHELASGGP